MPYPARILARTTEDCYVAMVDDVRGIRMLNKNSAPLYPSIVSRVLPASNGKDTVRPSMCVETPLYATRIGAGHTKMFPLDVRDDFGLPQFESSEREPVFVAFPQYSSIYRHPLDSQVFFSDASCGDGGSGNGHRGPGIRLYRACSRETDECHLQSIPCSRGDVCYGRPHCIGAGKLVSKPLYCSRIRIKPVGSRVHMFMAHYDSTEYIQVNNDGSSVVLASSNAVNTANHSGAIDATGRYIVSFRGYGQTDLITLWDTQTRVLCTVVGFTRSFTDILFDDENYMHILHFDSSNVLADVTVMRIIDGTAYRYTHTSMRVSGLGTAQILSFDLVHRMLHTKVSTICVASVHIPRLYRWSPETHRFCSKSVRQKVESLFMIRRVSDSVLHILPYELMEVLANGFVMALVMRLEMEESGRC